MNNKNVLLVLGGFLFVGAVGCTAPIVRTEPVAKEIVSDAFMERYYNADVEKGAKIVVIMSDESPSRTLGTFIMADLKDAGFIVKTSNPLDILPESILNKITSKTKYSFMDSAIKSIVVPGLNGDNEKIAIAADAAKAYVTYNDVREDDVRVNDLSKYIDDYGALLKKLDIDYVMTIRQGNVYSYYVEIIDPKTSSISGLYYLSANKEAWDKRMTALKDVSGRTVSRVVVEGESPRYAEMQYSHYLVNLITGKK